MGEKRNLESIIYIYICIILINVIYNIFFNLKLYGILNLESNFQLELKAIVEASHFISVSLIIMAFVCYNIEISAEEKSELNQKMKYMYLSHIFPLIYIVLTLAFVKDRDIIVSAMVIELLYIGATIITRKIKTLGLTDRQLKWKRAYGGMEDEIKESNFTWRYKVWLNPHVKVPFSKRWKGPIMFIYDIGVLYLIFTTSISFIYIFLLPSLFFWIEGLIGVHTSLTGKCTAIFAKPSRRGGEFDFEIYVTDFKNKREIKFVVFDDVSYIRENMVLTVVHGAFSKRVLYIEGLDVSIK